MSDEAKMLAAYAASYPDDTDRLILADWLEERGDVRGAWLRDPGLARFMGPTLDDPRPKLIAALTTDPAAAGLLARLGSADLAGLVEMLKSDDPRRQKAALTALGQLGEGAVPAAPHILALLREDREEVRKAAVATLGQLGSAADAALFAVRDRLDDSDREARRAVHAAAVRRGPQSPAVRILVADLATWDEDVSWSAAAALAELGPDVFEVVLREGACFRPEYRQNVFGVLRGLPGADRRLRAVAQDPTRDESSRCCAVQALVWEPWGERPSEYRGWLIPHLIDLTGDASDHVAREAATGLGRFAERADAAVPALVRLLDRAHNGMHAAILDALGELGPAARVALPAVRPLAGSPDRVVASAARRFLGQHDPTDLVEEIRRRLRADEPTVRVEHLDRLGETAWLFPDLPDRLDEALADPEPAVRQAGCDVLSNLRWPAGVEAVPFLRQSLGDPDAGVRIAALRSLEYARHLIPALLPDLLDRLRSDPDTGVRRAVVAVIRGPEDGHREPVPALESGPVRDALRAAVRDADGDVREAALETLLGLCWQAFPDAMLPDLVELVRTDHGQAGGRAILCVVQRFAPPPGFTELLREGLRLPPGPWENQAFSALHQLGYTPTLDDLPLFLQTMREDPRNAPDAAEMLRRLGEPAVPGLLALLAPGQPGRLRGWVAQAIGEIGPPARPALPALLEMLRSEDEFETGTAIYAVARIAEPAEVIETLRPFFRHRHGQVRRTMTHVAGWLGTAARPWLPDLLHLARTDGGTARVLAPLVRDEPALLDQVLALLDEPDPARKTAVETLEHLGPPAAVAVRRLRALLAEADPDQRRAIEQALQAIGQAGESDARRGDSQVPG